METTVATASQGVLAIASVCHDANRAYALAMGEDPATVWPTWHEAPQNIQESAIIGVQRALDGATPRELHESWCATKRADGWVYGELRSNAAKLHPCLVDYDKLPESQQRKDALFSAIVGALR